MIRSFPNFPTARRIVGVSTSFLLPVLLFLCVVHLPAQPLSDYRDGRILAYYQDNPYSFHFQDRQGFLWGTDRVGKVIRYNGYEAEYLPIAGADTTGLQWCSEGGVRFLEDSEGKIWIVSGQCGLDRYDPRTGQIENFNDEVYDVKGRSARIYFNIFEDSRKDIWLGIQWAVYRYSMETGAFSLGARFGFPFFVLEDRHANLWVGDPVVYKAIGNLRFSGPGQKGDIPFPFIGDMSRVEEFTFDKTIKTLQMTRCGQY